MRLSVDIIPPQEIIDQYNLLPLIHHGFVYIVIQKVVYGLTPGRHHCQQQTEKNI